MNYNFAIKFSGEKTQHNSLPSSFCLPFLLLPLLLLLLLQGWWGEGGKGELESKCEDSERENMSGREEERIGGREEKEEGGEGGSELKVAKWSYWVSRGVLRCYETWVTNKTGEGGKKGFAALCRRVFSRYNPDPHIYGRTRD